MMLMVVADAAGLVGVRERLEVFAGEVLGEAMNRPVQLVNGGLYLRGLIEQGPRKSLEPLVARLGEEADYQSLQQFLADSPWDPAAVACGRRAGGAADRGWGVGAGRHGVPEGRQALAGGQAPVLGDAGQDRQLPDRSLGARRGRQGDGPVGWALYLPPEWCEDAGRRHRAKIPEQVGFQTKPELGVELVERAAGWEVPQAPVLGDLAYGDNTELRERLHGAGRQYVLAVGATTTVFAPETNFVVGERAGISGRPRSRARPDRKPETIEVLVKRLGWQDVQSVSFRDGPDSEPMPSQFAFLRVRAGHRFGRRTPWPPRQEWLIAE